MIVERSPPPAFSVASEICDVEVGNGEPSGESREGFRKGRSITGFEIINAGNLTTISA